MHFGRKASWLYPKRGHKLTPHLDSVMIIQSLQKLADSEPDLSASEKKEQGTYDNQASVVWVLKLEHRSVDTGYKPSLPRALALRPSASHVFSSPV